MPTVELHGNLGQGARTRNMEAFHSGRATTLVATDIAARGIHVDDVSLVVHADPPAEHKAYLHRSGRTARAGSAGTVVTLSTPEQDRDVRDLARAAGIKPRITVLEGPGHPVLTELAPGERVLVPGGLVLTPPTQRSGSEGSGGSAGNGARRRVPAAAAPGRAGDAVAPAPGRPSRAGARPASARVSARVSARARPAKAADPPADAPRASVRSPATVRRPSARRRADPGRAPRSRRRSP